MGVQCCSNDFGQQICDEMSKGGLKLKLDPTGVFTDSASFIDLIPECTNISVGYFDEHTHKEMLNVSYLERLCEASVMCDWNGMKATRKLMEESESYRKYKKLANFLKKQVFYNFDAMRGEDDRFIYEMEVTDTNPLHLRQDLQKLQTSLIQNGIDAKTQLIFDSGKIRIELQ
jgi:hypothetical protein